MSQQTRQWLIGAAVGIAVGIALGVGIGWGLWPVTYTNTSPAALRADYRDEYVLMIATAYEVDGDRQAAHDRLALLDSAEPAAPVVDLAERLIEQGGRERDIVRLAELARALDTTAPRLMRYWES